MSLTPLDLAVLMDVRRFVQSKLPCDFSILAQVVWLSQSRTDPIGMSVGQAPYSRFAMCMPNRDGGTT
jgi:hypothetical protein